jgi:hypothetical protein
MYAWCLQNAHSRFGAFLDPVADKLMVSTLLVLLSTQPLAAGPLAGNDWLVPVCTLGGLNLAFTEPCNTWSRMSSPLSCVRYSPSVVAMIWSLKLVVAHHSPM